MVDQGENDKSRGKETLGSIGLLANMTFNNLLIWAGTIVAIILMILFAVGMYCLDGA